MNGSGVGARDVISLVIPFHNEAAVVAALFHALVPVLRNLSHADYEIVCVNDGSTDATLRELQAICASDARVKIVDLSRNFGKEAALTAGIDAASGNAVIPFDADLQDPPEAIPLLLAKWREGFDVVLARRAERPTDSFAKRITAALFYRVHNAISDISIPENAGDFRLMSRQVVDALKALPENRRFMKGLFAWVGFRTAEITYARRPRAAGKSTFSGWRLWNFALDGMTSFGTLPLRVWSYLGGMTAVFAIQYAVYLLFRTARHGIDVPGYASIITAILFLGGAQLIGIGVIGEYVGRMYMEAKRRPVYIVRQVYQHDGSTIRDLPLSATRPVLRSVSDRSHLIWLLPVHALVWTIAAWLSRGNLDMPGDMVENYVWGIEWQAGYLKHPPLFAWIAAAWFRVFPHVDIAYFALSAVNAMVGLLGIVALAGRFLPRPLAVVAGLAMAVSPLYSNLAIKFNANAVLLSVWPWTAFFFVRFMQTGTWRQALALGVLAGASLLGKYFSVVLLLSLSLAALVRPAWRARLFSTKTLGAVLACGVVLLPHLHWLVVNDFPTFGYAEDRTGGTLLPAVVRLGKYTAAQLAYLLPSAVFVVLLLRGERLQALRLIACSYLRPSTSTDLWWLAMGPLIVVGTIAFIMKTQMASVWGMAQWFAIVPLWLTVIGRAGGVVRPERAVRVMGGYWLIVLAATAAVGYMGVVRKTDDATAPRAELAAAADALWQQRTGSSIPIVVGPMADAGSIAFYGNPNTRYWNVLTQAETPWFNVSSVRREGALFVCQSDEPACIDDAASFSGVAPVSISVSKQAWGMTLPARRYVLFPMLPHARVSP